MISIAYVTRTRVAVTLIVDNRRGRFVDFEWWEYFPNRVGRAARPHLLANRRPSVFSAFVVHITLAPLPGCSGNRFSVFYGLVVPSPVLWHSPGSPRTGRRAIPGVSGNWVAIGIAKVMSGLVAPGMRVGVQFPLEKVCSSLLQFCLDWGGADP